MWPLGKDQSKSVIVGPFLKISARFKAMPKDLFSLIKMDAKYQINMVTS